MRSFVEHWAGDFADNIKVLPYFAIQNQPKLPVGTYVFSDLERTTADQRSYLGRIYQRLKTAIDPRALVNHPMDSLRRYELLLALRQRGINAFSAYWAMRVPEQLNYPVFLREENRHNGNVSPLVDDLETLNDAIRKAVDGGIALENLLIVEFCDTKGEDGLYRKYSSFRIGDTILPRHILYSHNWMLKDEDILEPVHRLEIREYCRENPHEQELMNIFKLANIDYGRIDYALLDGKIQVWEINTNPLTLKPPAQYADFSIEFHTEFAERFKHALAQPDVAGNATQNMVIRPRRPVSR
jgi:hypothetical protein